MQVSTLIRVALLRMLSDLKMHAELSHVRLSKVVPVHPRARSANVLILTTRVTVVHNMVLKCLT